VTFTKLLSGTGRVAEMECDDIQTDVLMNRFEYDKKINYEVLVVKCHLIYAFYFF
jgi:hypothetical protein